MAWADKYRRLNVRTNADTPEDAKRAREYGAEGIGLCRTEHMFFEDGRISAMREMIIAEAQPEREAALKKLLPFQRKDFEGIFTAMKGLPVTVRLLDPPLHEFLPHDSASQSELAKTLGVPVVQDQESRAAVARSQPDARSPRMPIERDLSGDPADAGPAIVEATINCRKKQIEAQPEIMIPLVGTAAELQIAAGPRRGDHCGRGQSQEVHRKT